MRPGEQDVFYAHPSKLYLTPIDLELAQFLVLFGPSICPRPNREVVGPSPAKVAGWFEEASCFWFQDLAAHKLGLGRNRGAIGLRAVRHRSARWEQRCSK